MNTYPLEGQFMNARWIVCAAMSVISLALSYSAFGATVNVDLNGSASVGGSGTTYPDGSSGALVTADAQHWNGVSLGFPGPTGDNTFTSGAFTASDGTTPTGITLTLNDFASSAGGAGN